MAYVRRFPAVALIVSLVAAGCGMRALSADGGPPVATPDGQGNAGGQDLTSAPAQPLQPLLPPVAPAGLTYRPCGGLATVPELIGVDADGDAVLIATGFGQNASLHLFSLRTGRVMRTLNIDGATGVLTADRLHVITPTALVDLRAGSSLKSPPPTIWNDDLLAVSPSGDVLIGWVSDTFHVNGRRIVLKQVADGSLRDLPLSDSDEPFAAVVADDGQRFFLLFDRYRPSLGFAVTIEVRQSSDGTLEREIVASNEVPVPGASGRDGQLNPQLTTSGDLLLVNLKAVGYRAFRVSDGALVWSPGPDVKQAQLSPQVGVVISRASDTASWQERDLQAGRVVGTFAPSQVESTRQDSGASLRPLLALGPDGSEVVFHREGTLWSGHSDASTSPLPFVSDNGQWAGRSIFVTPSEVVTVEITGANTGIGVRKRAVPGGEMLAEMSSGESQTEWDGDIAVSPDGHLIAVAFPDNVHVLRATDLTEMGVIQRAAGRVAWSSDGTVLLTTTDLHYRDRGRPSPEVRASLDVWVPDGRRLRTYDLPFIPMFATFTADGRSIVATGRQGNLPHVDGGFEQVLLSGPLQSVKIDRATGQTTSTPLAALATDSGGRYGTDLRSIIRLNDGAAIASLDLPVANGSNASASDLPPVAGEVPARHRAVFSPDAALVADLASPSNEALSQLVIYEAATGKRLQTVPLLAGSEYLNLLGTLAFSPDGRRLAAQAWGGSTGNLHFLCAAP
jgi:hypothetical protein